MIDRDFRRRVARLGVPFACGSDAVVQGAACQAYRREFTRRISADRPEQVIEFAALLIDLDPRILVYAVVQLHRHTLRALDAATIESVGQGIADWASVDVLDTLLAGSAWVRRWIADQDVHRWARSPDCWWRRTALVATIGLNTKTGGGYGDAQRTLADCEVLADDRDDMAVKALSWALRVLAPARPKCRQNLSDQKRSPPGRTSDTRSQQQANNRCQKPTQSTWLDTQAAFFPRRLR